MKYVIYLRVSTDQQVSSGLGLDAQREICLKYISQNGYHPFFEFIDDGYSGSLCMDKRPNLLLALDALEKDDIFMVAKRDRLGRDLVVNAMIERVIERKKAKIVSASGDFRNDNDPMSIFMKRMIDAFAEYERLIIGARTKAALQVKKRKNERVGHIPFGYRLCNDKIHIEKDESEQKLLKMIREGREFGLTFRQIADDLNEIKCFNRSNRPWNHVSLQRVIK